MGWFHGAFESALFFACVLMFVYNVIMLARTRSDVLLRAGQMTFWVAMMLTAVRIEPDGLGDDWSFWVALVLLLASVALTLAHKRRTRHSPTDAGAESGRS